MKAEYLRYSMILIVSLFKQNRRNLQEMMSKISIFTFMVLNSDISIIFLRNIFKLSVVVLYTITERTVAQISFLGLTSNFRQFRKYSFQEIAKCFPFLAMK